MYISECKFRRERFNEKSNLSEVSEPVEEYNWINPSRSATDKEFEQMIVEAEKEKGIPAEVAREQTIKLLDKWISEQKK